jgi:hypothetical protein
VLAIAGSAIGTTTQGDRRDADSTAGRNNAPIQRSAHEANIPVPKIDVARLEAVARDQRENQRVLPSSEAIEAGFSAASVLRDALFAPMAGRELDAAMCAAIVADPKAHRGKLFRARGWIEDPQQLDGPPKEESPRHLFRVRLEGGGGAWCAAAEFPDGEPQPDRFVRVDGLFLEVQREEISGQWTDAPLLIGPRAVESFPRIEPVRSLEQVSFALVDDDSVQKGFSALPVTEYWSLVSYAQHVDPSTIDWSAAPELDGATINKLFADGRSWRGKPVRIRACRVLGIGTEAVDENPLRIDRLTTGWLGRDDWNGEARVARFVSPLPDVPVKEGDGVTARGFFFKNLGYSPREGGAAIAPFFVLQSIERRVPVFARSARSLMYIVGGSLALVALAIWFLLRRNEKNSGELQVDLARRRKLRRERLST